MSRRRLDAEPADFIEQHDGRVKRVGGGTLHHRDVVRPRDPERRVQKLAAGVANRPHHPDHPHRGIDEFAAAHATQQLRHLHDHSSSGHLDNEARNLPSLIRAISLHDPRQFDSVTVVSADEQPHHVALKRLRKRRIAKNPDISRQEQRRETAPVEQAPHLHLVSALQRRPQRRVGNVGRGHPNAPRGILDGEIDAVSHGQRDHAPNADLRPLAPHSMHAREHAGDVGGPEYQLIRRRNARRAHADGGEQPRKQHLESPAALHAVSPTRL